MNDQKQLTLKGMTKTHGLLVASCFGMLAVSIYLTNHYFITHYPTELSGKAFCNFNSFFNCDTVSYSAIATIFGIPLSVYGIITSLLFLIGSLFPTRNIEGTNRIISIANFAGCVALFFYSLLGLGKLCPICVIYYVFSGLSCYLYWKHSELKSTSVKVLASYGAFALIVYTIFFFVIDGKKELIEKQAPLMINQYKSYPNLGTPEDMGYYIDHSKVEFSKAPIQMTVFSDFECPACSLFAKITPNFMSRYGDKVKIQFYPYPLDRACNPNMSRDLHRNACNASYLAYCLKDQFGTLHDELFENSKNITQTYLEKIAKKNNVLECYKSDKTKEAVQKAIYTADQFNVQSTPTVILNGVKIEGVLPLQHWYSIMDYLVKGK